MGSRVYDVPRTSELPFFSSLHGRAQRNLRGIERRDLQAAVKYGRKERAMPSRRTGAMRWKYTYANVVFITDETSTKEITSYAEPLAIPSAELTLGHIREHENAKERLRRYPSQCTSHTVIVVDHSASMRTSDVFDFPNRAKAVFGMLALDFVAKQRLSGEATNTDVVSLVLMHDGVDVVFEREPMGLVLYNKFVGMHDLVRPRSHGNFMPSLDQAEQLLMPSPDDSGSALCLLFLSDGKPSDNATGILRGNNWRTSAAISDRMGLLAATFRHRLSVATLGFANDTHDFSVLEAMAKAANSAGAKGDFHRPELSSAGLGSAIAHSVSSLTATKTKLSTVLAPAVDSKGAPLPTLREEERESAGGSSWRVAPTTCLTGDGLVIYTDAVKRYEISPASIGGLNANPWVQKSFLSPRASGIAIRRKAIGEGAERLVFEMQEFDPRKGDLVGPELVAKQGKHVEHDELASIQIAAKSLSMAARSATSFNDIVMKRLSIYGDLDGRDDGRVWRVSFLSFSLYSFMEAGVKRSFLAEKRLVPAHRYTKWNGNNGYVFHGRGPVVLTPSSELPPRDARKAHCMEGPGKIYLTGDGGCGGYDSDGRESTGSAEPDEEVDYGAGAEAYKRGILTVCSLKRGRDELPMNFHPRPADYLQAFSHFSYWHSCRKMLVCDLQGVMSDNPSDGGRCAGVFELTDPVIHYNSQSGRKQVYGRTDLGKKGMHRFFETHDCNDVCRLLGLPRCRSPAAEAAEAKSAAGAGEAQAPGDAPQKRRRTGRFKWVP